DVFKNTVCPLLLLQFLIGRDAFFRNCNHLSRLNVPDKLCSYGCKGTALRCDNVSIVPLSDTERFQTERISHGDQFSRAHHDKSISTPDPSCCMENSLLHISGVDSLSRNIICNHLGICRCMENGTSVYEFFFQTCSIDQISIMRKSQRPLDIIQNKRLCILSCRASRC